MADIFKMCIFGSKGALHDTIDVKNLFVNWLQVTPKQIIESCNCFSLYTTDKMWNNDLVWSRQIILNWIKDKGLKGKVWAHLEHYGKINWVGPLTFYLTLKEIAHCNATAIDNLASSLAHVLLENFLSKSTDNHGL